MSIKIINSEFGIDFAERQLNDENINVKKVDYYLQNKIRELNNFSENWLESASPNQSYSMVGGKPKDKIFGNNIVCSDKVSFHLYGETNKEILNKLINTTYQSNEVVKSSIIINKKIPRINIIKNSGDITSEKLFKKLNDYIENRSDLINITFVGMVEELNNVSFINFDDLKIYEKRATENNKIKIESIDELIKFIETNKKTKLEEVKVKYSTDNEKDSQTDYLINLLDITLEDQKKQYIFTRKKWHYFNKTFLEILDKQLDNITVELKNNSTNIDRIENENDYIYKLASLKKYDILHQKYVRGLSVPVEIADLYDSTNGELYAVKMGLESNDTVYSLNQSMLAMTLLKSSDNFNYSNISKSEKYLEKLKKSMHHSILWVLLEHQSPKKATSRKYLTAFNNNTLKLTMIASLHIKLKISEWYSVAKQLNFEPKIYFTKVEKIDKKN